MANTPHLDAVAGRLARIAQLVRPRVKDTTHRLGCYEGLAAEQLLPAPERLPLVRRRRRWRLPGLLSEDLSFQSLHEPLEPEFHRYYHRRPRRIHTVYARRIVPATGRSRGRLLYIHGYMQPETVIEEFALISSMARALEMEVIQLQPPYHGRRKPRGSRFDGELYWTADLVRSIESIRQTVIDARALLSWMLYQSPRPVGIAGLSLGGALSAVLSCVEPRFSFSAPFIAHMDLGALFAGAPVLGAMRDDLEGFGWSPGDFAAFIERTGWNELRPVIPAERIHLFAMEDDLFFRPTLVERMWKDWGEPAIQWYPGSHLGFFASLPDAIPRLRGFIDALDLRPSGA